MNKELPLYQGAVPQAAQEQYVQVPQLPRMQMHGEALDNAISAGLDAVDKYADLHDFGVRQEAERQLRRNELEMQQEFERKSALQPGAEGSFYTAEGALDEDAVAAFTDKWQQRNREVARPFWKRGNALRGEDELAVRNDRLAGDVGLGLLRQESARRSAVFKDNFDLAVAQGDTAGACRIVDDAVASGQITEARGKVMKLGVARRSMRAVGRAAGLEDAPVNIGGSEYNGLSAELAAQKARDGGLGGDVAPGDGDVVQGDGELGDPSMIPAPPEEGGDVDEAIRMADAGAVVDADAPLEYFFETGDLMPVLPRVAGTDFNGFMEDLAVAEYGIRMEDGEDGTPSYYCSATAPEVVERTVAHAGATGGVSAEDARSMVANISLSLLSENPETSDSEMDKVFEGSGIYEALGDGDAEVGKVRAMGIVREAKKRSQGGTPYVSMESIGKVVDAHVGEVEDPLAWQIDDMMPKTVQDGKWDKSKLSEAERRQWFQLYREYGRYRQAYRTEKGLDTQGEPDKDEFEPVAQDFYKWYKKNVYGPEAKARIEARRKALKDWYMGEIMEALAEDLRNNEGSLDYGASYAGDMDVVREVMRRRPPADLGAEALLAAREKREAALHGKTEKFRIMAQEDFARLQGLKAYEKENGEKVRRAKAKAEEAEAKRVQKQQEEEEKRQQKARRVRLNAERMRPRQAEWAWDGRNAAYGEVAMCTIPEKAYEELVGQLGYDGTQEVYLQVQGAQVRVVGTNKAGKIMLNTTAVGKIQKRPNTKKGERWSYGGNLGYSYIFKNISDK